MAVSCKGSEHDDTDGMKFKAGTCLTDHQSARMHGVDQVHAESSVRDSDLSRSQAQPSQQEQQSRLPDRLQQPRHQQYQRSKPPHTGPLKALDTIDLLPRPVIADYIIQIYVSLIRQSLLRSLSVFIDIPAVICNILHS